MRYPVAAFFAVVLSATAAVANASTITTSASYGPALTDFTTPTLTLQSFNTSLGTLTSVALTFTVSGVYSGTVTNRGGTTDNLDNPFLFTELTRFQTTSAIAALNRIRVTASNLEDFGAVATNQTVTYTPATATATTTATPTSLAPFLDKAATPLAFTFYTVTGQSIFGGGGNATSSISTLADATLSAVYTYTPAVLHDDIAIPEPASTALLITFLLGTGLIRWTARYPTPNAAATRTATRSPKPRPASPRSRSRRA